MTIPAAGWDFRGFTREFTLFGDFVLAFGAIAEKYCTPEGGCTDFHAAGTEVMAMMDRWSDAELATLQAFIRGIREIACPEWLKLLDVTQRIRAQSAS